MIKTILAASVGFVTPALVVLTITGVSFGISETARWIGAFDLPLAAYWSGFGLFFGICLVAGTGFAIWQIASH